MYFYIRKDVIKEIETKSDSFVGLSNVIIRTLF